MRKLSDRLAMIGRFFVFVGLIALMSGAYHAVGAAWMIMAGGVETMGIYTEDEQGENYIQYAADGRLYQMECALGGHPGEQVAVRYLPDAPQRARMTDWGKLGEYVFSGLLFSAAGMCFMSAMIREKRMLQALLRDGVWIQAQIDEIESKRFLTEWRRYHRVTANMKHPGTGRCVHVSSGWLLDHPGKYLTDGTVPVLTDQMDENRYYMKLERGEPAGYKKMKVESGYWGNR